MQLPHSTVSDTHSVQVESPMCSDNTLEKVRNALKKPLLPISRLKAQWRDWPLREVSVEELLSPGEHDEFVQNAFRNTSAIVLD